VTEVVKRLHVIVEGRVQGVGFRYFVQETAIELELKGWVRNRWDGSVEVLVEGDPDVLNQLLEELHRGPRSSIIERVIPQWLPATGEFSRFSVRSTA